MLFLRMSLPIYLIICLMRNLKVYLGLLHGKD